LPVLIGFAGMNSNSSTGQPRLLSIAWPIFVEQSLRVLIGTVDTFMVSHDGIVYQKDLGADTLNIFKSLERFNPDKTWSLTNDEP
jgi:hypothetical protein